MCMCISFRPAVGHVEASGAQRNPKLYDGHNGIAEQQELQECEEQEAIVQILPSLNWSQVISKMFYSFHQLRHYILSWIYIWRMKWKS